MKKITLIKSARIASGPLFSPEAIPKEALEQFRLYKLRAAQNVNSLAGVKNEYPIKKLSLFRRIWNFIIGV